MGRRTDRGHDPFAPHVHIGFDDLDGDDPFATEEGDAAGTDGPARDDDAIAVAITDRGDRTAGRVEDVPRRDVGVADPAELLAGAGTWRDHLDGLTGGLVSRLRPASVAGVGVVVLLVVVVLLRPGSGGSATAELPMAPAALDAGHRAGTDGPPEGDGDRGVSTGPADGAAGGERGDDAGATDRADGTAGPDEDRSLAVHVAGAVARPGMHVLAAGGRVADALDAAGGAAPGADLDRINLAAPVEDGTRIWVPTIGGEVPELVEPDGRGGAGGTAAGSSGSPGVGPSTGAGTSGPASPVDLNTADAAALEALPGVGPATAAAIVAHREANGPFRSVDDLLEVRGIGPSKLEQIRPLATV